MRRFAPSTLTLLIIFSSSALAEPVREAVSPDISVAKPNFVRCMGHVRRVRAVVLTPDGKSAISGGDDPFLIVWNATNGREITRIMRRVGKEELDPALCLGLTPDGRKVGALSGSQTVHFWDIATGKLEKETLQLAAPAFRWALSSDRALVAQSGFADIRVNDLKQNKILWKKDFSSQEIGIVSELSFSPDGKHLAAALLDSGGRKVSADKLQVWDVTSGKRVFSAWPDCFLTTSAAYSADGKLLAAAGARLQVWESSTFKSVFSAPSKPKHSLHPAILCLSFHPSGASLAAGSEDGSISLWDSRRGTILSTFHEHSGNVRGVYFSADGAKLASCGEDKSVVIWTL